jgi:hypothetical protein
VLFPIFLWTFLPNHVFFYSKLVGAFVGFCARSFMLFHQVPSFGEELKNIMKIVLKPMKRDKKEIQWGQAFTLIT